MLSIQQGIKACPLKAQIASKYYQEYYKNCDFEDTSFAFVTDKNSVGYVSCHAIEKNLCFNKFPIKLNSLGDFSTKEGKKVIEHIEHIAHEKNYHNIVFESHQLNPLCNLGMILLRKKYRYAVVFDALISAIDFNVESHWKQIRKSYRSLINYGKKNFLTEVYDHTNWKPEKLDELRKLHIQEAGFVSRPKESWDLQGELVQNGAGRLVLSYFQNRLLSGSLFIDENNVTSYAVGAYDRSVDEPAHHYPVYLGILKSIEENPQGMVFLGRRGPHLKLEKHKNIQLFKEGFTGNLHPVIIWQSPSRDGDKSQEIVSSGWC